MWHPYGAIPGGKHGPINQQTRFLSPPPEVRILTMLERPLETAVAAARTCYSSHGLVTADDVAAGSEATRDRIARGIYKGGHHTTFQHGYVQFALSNVSRQFLWAFLHSHTFYNSEQVSQRYVAVNPGAFAVPPLSGEAKTVYIEGIGEQIAAYHRLVELLTPLVEAAYVRRFPRRPASKATQRDIWRKALEVARYVLPVAVFAYLYHTVSVLTLLRYWRLCQGPGASLETRIVVGQMVEALLAADPPLATILEEPLPPTSEAMPEIAALATLEEDTHTAGFVREFACEFDQKLDGSVSRLVAYKPDNEALVAQAVRGALGMPVSALSDPEAVELALSPARNPHLAGALNLTTLSRLSRALYHAHYTFYKKLSHTADSQNQRHRMTPATRPVVSAYLNDAPDYITPELVRRDETVQRFYDGTMARVWERIGRLKQLGVPDEFRAYLLPNAVSVRLVESADLLNLRHKLAMRLCYNAQEEIWRASLDEAEQVREVNPTIGRYLLPPCALRALASERPYCPEGDRYCGVRVWELELEAYERLI
jgi:thymidylate synthase ThyX